MNNAPNILVFSIVMGLIFIAMDLYTLSRWSAFTKRNAMHHLWRVIPWSIAGVMVGVTSWVVFRRHLFRVDGLDAVLIGISSFWYLPKFGIVVVLLLRDLVRLVARLFHWKGARKSERLVLVTDADGSSDVDEMVSAEGTTRRAFLEKSAWSLAAVPYFLVGNGLYRTLYDYQVYNVDITLPNLPRSMDGMRVVQISDLHAGSYLDHQPMQEARRLVQEQRPDLVVITGDFVNSHPKELEIIAGELARFRAPEGVLASLGNHDHYNTPSEHQALVKGIRELGIDLLVNEHRRIGNGDASVVIAGTDNTGFRQNFGDLDQALQGVEEGEPIVLLAHDPTFWDKEVVSQRSVDLMLAGHTHGGQFGVQALGFEWSPAQYVYEQWAGLYRKGDQALYVNRGLGTVGPPIRIGIPPEITVFTLRAPTLQDRFANA